MINVDVLKTPEQSPDSIVEIWSIKLDSWSHKIFGENTFPDSYVLKASNNKSIYQANKLDINSSLKKRKDNSLYIRYDFFRSLTQQNEKLIF